jgi:hypothetical protein
LLRTGLRIEKELTAGGWVIAALAVSDYSATRMAVCRSAARQDLDANQKSGSVVCGFPGRIAALRRCDDGITTRDGREYPKTSLQASGLQHRKASISKAVNLLKIARCSTASAIFTDDKIALIEVSLEAGAGMRGLSVTM